MLKLSLNAQNKNKYSQLIGIWGVVATNKQC